MKAVFIGWLDPLSVPGTLKLIQGSRWHNLDDKKMESDIFYQLNAKVYDVLDMTCFRKAASSKKWNPKDLRIF
ncbi:MAG TPA: hypothetical protein VIK44_04660 [Acetobacterium sp.]